MDPEDKIALEDKIKQVETQFETAKKRSVDLKMTTGETLGGRETYDLERYKNSKLFQKFMKQEGGNVLQKPVLVKPAGPSPPPFQEETRELEDVKESREEYDDTINARRSFSPETTNAPQAALLKSATGSTDMELEGFSEHIPASPVRAQMYTEMRTSYPQAQQPPMYPPMYPPYYYPAPLGIPPIAPVPGMIPSQMDMQLYFKQMMDMYQRPSVQSTVREVSPEVDSRVEEKDKEIKKLQKQLESAKLDIMQLEDQLQAPPAYKETGKGDLNPDLRVQNLSQELEDLHHRYEATEDELIHTQRECDKAKEELAALKAKKPQPIDDSQIQDKIVQLEYKLEGALEKSAGLEKTLAKEKDINAEAERRLEIARSRIAKMEESAEELQQRLQTKNEEFDDMKRDFMQQLRQMQKEMEALRNETESLRIQNERLLAQKDQLAQELRTRPMSEPQDSYRRPVDRPRRDPYEEEPVPTRGGRTQRKEEQYPEPEDPPPRRDFPAYENQSSRPRTTRGGGDSYEVRPQIDSPPPLRREEKTGLTHFDMVKSFEKKLLSLQIDKDRILVEYNKIPEHSKTIAQRRRREDLEQDLEILNSNINSLKTKLRNLNSTKS